MENVVKHAGVLLLPIQGGRFFEHQLQSNIISEENTCEKQVKQKIKKKITFTLKSDWKIALIK